MFSKIFAKKKILIYGLGLSGNSCLKFLKNKSSVKIFDDNYLLKSKKNKKFFIKKDVILKSKFDYIILSPGIDLKKCNLKKYLKKKP